jgi:hypothetical protein
MRRREFLKRCSVFTAGLGLGAPSLNRAHQPAHPLEVGIGPHLFLDDYLIDQLDGLTRHVEPPKRLPKPVLDSATFGTTQPYLTVLHDTERPGYRVWYNRGPAIWHAVSSDGVHWGKPRLAWDLARSYGASLVDDGKAAAEPERRFKLANWQATRGRDEKTSDNAGMYVGFSHDGLRWTAYDHNPVLSGWPEGFPKISRHGVGDIVDVYFDPLRRRYAAAMKLHALPEEGYAPAPRAGKVFRRLVGLSTSKDFLHWEKPWRIFTPDQKDDGLLEFYGMGGMHQRGALHIGLVRVLRDDLACDADGPKDGIGYSVLATSRDGVQWQRFRTPFLDRNPERGSWDHAMSWIGGTLPVGDEVYFYYGGYARGHKIAPDKERQIGLARLKKDRYVALAPDREQGTLRTKAFLVPGPKLTVNLRAPRGEVRVRLLDQAGKPLAALGAADAKPLTGDALAGEVCWPQSLGELQGKSVRLEFRVRHAQLFGFELHGEKG